MHNIKFAILAIFKCGIQYHLSVGQLSPLSIPRTEVLYLLNSNSLSPKDLTYIFPWDGSVCRQTITCWFQLFLPLSAPPSGLCFSCPFPSPSSWALKGQLVACPHGLSGFVSSGLLPLHIRSHSSHLLLSSQSIWNFSSFDKFFPITCPCGFISFLPLYFIFLEFQGGEEIIWGSLPYFTRSLELMFLIHRNCDNKCLF